MRFASQLWLPEDGILVMHIPAWIAGQLMSVIDRMFPKRPRLTVEIRQVCFDTVLASLDADFKDYTIDLYWFVLAWVANTKEVTTTVKEWKLAVFGGGQEIDAERIFDFSRWHQHIKVKEERQGHYLIRDVRANLDAFPAQPLQHGIGTEGWVCFLTRAVTEQLFTNATVKLTIVDSFGKEHVARSRGPWPCKGDMVNPDMPW
jgi:hypothetical protein